MQSFISFNSLIFKEFSERTAPEEARIIRTLNGPSSPFQELLLSLEADARKSLLARLTDMRGTQLEDEGAVDHLTTHLHATRTEQITGRRSVLHQTRLIKDRRDRHILGREQFHFRQIVRQLLWWRLLIGRWRQLWRRWRIGRLVMAIGNVNWCHANWQCKLVVAARYRPLRFAF